MRVSASVTGCRFPTIGCVTTVSGIGAADSLCGSYVQCRFSHNRHIGEGKITTLLTTLALLPSANGHEDKPQFPAQARIRGKRVGSLL